MDKLSPLIEHDVVCKKWKSFRVGVHGVDITHLMFVDDLLLFGDATEVHMDRMKHTLNEFYAMHGQEISMDKSSIFFREICLVGYVPDYVIARGLKKPTALANTWGFP